MDVSASPAAAEPQFSLSHEPDPKTLASSDSSLFEKISTATRGVFSKHGVTWKRGPGRPRKDGGPAKSDVAINAPPTAIPALAASPAPLPDQEGLDPALVKRCCSAVLKAIAGVADKILHKKAIAAKFTPEEARQLVVDTTITQAEMDSFSELSEICLRKYGVGTKYAPEIGLGLILGSIGIRYSVAIKALDPEKPQNVVRMGEGA